MYVLFLFFIFPKFINIFLKFIFREGGWKERERNIQCAKGTLVGCLWHSLNWGPGPQPRHVP